jgi:hypothetical protein
MQGRGLPLPLVEEARSGVMGSTLIHQRSAGAGIARVEDGEHRQDEAQQERQSVSLLVVISLMLRLMFVRQARQSLLVVDG